MQNLLVLVRLRSGTLKLHPAMADVGDVVEEAIRRSGPLTGHHRIVPQLESHAVAFLDSERMALVVRNLVESACSRAQPGADIVLRLEDDGELARIHAHYSPHHGAGPHVRAGPDLDLGWLDELEEHTGLGVGRHVIRKIVEAHGGEFGHEQLEEAQACEWLTIPVSVEETRDAARP